MFSTRPPLDHIICPMGSLEIKWGQQHKQVQEIRQGKYGWCPSSRLLQNNGCRCLIVDGTPPRLLVEIFGRNGGLLNRINGSSDQGAARRHSSLLNSMCATIIVPLMAALLQEADETASMQVRCARLPSEDNGAGQAARSRCARMNRRLSSCLLVVLSSPPHSSAVPTSSRLW